MTESSDKLARENAELRKEIQRLRQCQQSRLQDEHRLKDMFDNIHDAYFQIDLHGTIQQISPSIETLLEYNREDLIGTSAENLFVNPDHFTKLVEKLRQNRHLRDYEIEVHDREGRPIYGAVTASLVCEEPNKPACVFGVLRDINKRKQAEIALIESERSLYTLLSNLPGVAYRCHNDPEWTMEFLSHGCKDLTGYTPGDLLYNNRISYNSIIHPDDRENVRDAIQKSLTNNQPFRLIHRIVCRDGHEKTVCGHGQSVKDENGQIVAIEGIILDITEEKRAAALEKQLRHSQKMEAIGRLAGGVAHDFNNMLMIIRNYTEFAMEQLPQDSPPRQDLTEVLTASELAADLTKQLLAFSRRQIMSPRVININDLISDMKNVLQQVIQEDIILTTEQASDLQMTNIDPGQLEQVILKLAINASEAMPNGGKLTISTSNTKTGQPVPESLKTGQYVELNVTDTGIGMSDEVKSKVFEPFFTTKELGRGSGLGLSTVYGIVKQMGGTITVTSTPGKGSTFHVYLPRHTGKPADLQPTIQKTTKGTERILLVEDQPAVRAATSRMLEHCGYTVITAEHAQEALDLCQHDNIHIDLLLSDIVMPGMNGCELTEHLRKNRPALKAILMSGHPMDYIVKQHAAIEKEHFLQKPFSLQVLTRKVRDVLDE